MTETPTTPTNPALDNTVADRFLMTAKPGSKTLRPMHHIDVCSNAPRAAKSRATAMRLTAAMAETIRFNLTARGFRVRVEFV